MPNSQNGYAVFTAPRYDGPLPRLRAWKVPGTSPQVTLPVRDGSVGFLLTYIALWMHERIEPIDKPHPKDDWGYAFRAIRGQENGYSNHASGTAVDIDATQHPLGVGGTFRYLVRSGRGRVMAETRIRWFLRARLKGTVRWGGDYNSRKDEMHFEVMAPIERCEAVARKLMRTKRGRAILDANPGAEKAILA